MRRPAGAPPATFFLGTPRTFFTALPGVAAAAFHGLIRTAHAVQSGHAGEVAAALAYWAWRWQPLAPPPQGGEALPFDDWAARLDRRCTHGLQGWACHAC